MGMRRRLPFAIAIALGAACGSPSAADLRDGDFVFHTARSAQSGAIQRATDSPCSHLGIAFQLERTAPARPGSPG
jgi:hypothetical protein